MVEDDPFVTQRDGLDVAAELDSAGFADAVEIGRGGFGRVYRCVQRVVDRTVAVKVLTGDHHDDRERFFREERAMAQLTGHPNIVDMFEVGMTVSGLPYIVMPYHARGSLDTHIRHIGPLPLAETLRLGVKLAGALETAHRAAVLHRDIKPSNILITDYDQPALADFGIARITGGFETSTGTVTGSPAFTAPEVLAGASPSPASDVYGLAATLFCALTGHAAFERRSGEQLVAQFVR
ncbi:serine/threonine-protein kinase, partial [Nocardia sp. NPDC060220]|uniref:serine/threonine-protein kinase n=1 Tax=Nocardia sp. NPDC060220 TaxID=3347076 RepID=UPI0036551D2E